MLTSQVSRIAAAGAIAAAASFSAAASAGAADLPNPTVTSDGGAYTMALRSHTTSSTFTPKGGTPTTAEPAAPPAPGDVYAFSEDLSQGGTKVGSDTGKCLLIGPSTSDCSVSVTFANGTLAVRGVVNFTDENAPSMFKVVGGTGAFEGALGVVKVAPLNEEDSDLTVTYRLAKQVAALPAGGAEAGAGSTSGLELPWALGLGAAGLAAGAALYVAGTRRSYV
jgi:hypothetical protein